METSSQYSLAIHGGAGTILKEQMTDEKERAYTQALKKALHAGEEILKKGGSAVEAVEASVISLEDCPLFNAGRGAVFANDETQEMEASVMCGQNLEAGAVAGISQVKNPISLACRAMTHSDFAYLSGRGALDFAKEQGLPLASNEYFFTQQRYDQMLAAKSGGKTVLDHDGERKFGTVGAVAMDRQGNIAAATSTGGLTNKKYGRLGDSSVIGAGTYAKNQTCAVSCTGYGEFFLRAVVGHDISCLMEYKGLSLQEACKQVVMRKLVKMGGEGGVIAVDSKGNIELCFNSAGMYRGKVSANTQPQVFIYKND